MNLIQSANVPLKLLSAKLNSRIHTANDQYLLYVLRNTPDTILCSEVWSRYLCTSVAFEGCLREDNSPCGFLRGPLRGIALTLYVCMSVCVSGQYFGILFLGY